MLRTSAKGLLKEARRRRVFRAAGIYIVGAWIVVQIALAAFPALSISERAVRYVWIAAMLGFPLAMVFGWRYDIRGGRIIKTGSASSDVLLSLVRADFVILAAISVVIVAILAGSLREISSMDSPQDRSYLAVDIDSASVAVLPFVNMSADANNEYFSDGLTETLLHMLAQLDDLKVAARTSSFAFKGQYLDIRDIALELGVAHVLEGSVQKAGERVRITVQLIRADDGFHVWSHNYDRALDDIFEIQDEISTDVAAALGSSLLTAENEGIHSIDTDDFNAYDVYLRALEQQNINTYDALLEAERLFTAAIEKDPDFVDAKLGLARNYIWQWRNDIDDVDRFDLTAQELIREVREQRPDNLQAELMDLLMQFYIGFSEKTQWGPEAELQAIVDEIFSLAQSTSIDSFLTRNVVQIISGYPRHQDDEAMELLRAALEADPLNFELLWAQANLYRTTDHPEEARQPLLTAAKLAPQNPQIRYSLGDLASRQGEYAEALDWFRQASILDPEDPLLIAYIADIFYDVDVLEEGDYWLEQLRRMKPDECLISSVEVRSADLAGDHDRLLELVTRDLALVIEQPGFCYFPIDYFIWSMGERGQAQQALDFLMSLVPQLQDYETVITDNRRNQYIHLMSAWLQYEVLEQESFRTLYDAHIGALNNQYPKWRDMLAPVYEISHQSVLGNIDVAKAKFLETYTHTNHWRWQRLLRYPWLEELRNDPEVVLVIEQYLQTKAGFADDVRQILDRPEWSH